MTPTTQARKLARARKLLEEASQLLGEVFEDVRDEMPSTRRERDRLYSISYAAQAADNALRLVRAV